MKSLPQISGETEWTENEVLGDAVEGEDAILEALSHFAEETEHPVSDETALVPAVPRGPTPEQPLPHPQVYFPDGLTLWRETNVGQALIEALNELVFEGSLAWEDVDVLLQVFDHTMTTQFPKLGGGAGSHAKITAGRILQYKNLDGTWVFYVSGLGLKFRHARFSSPLTRIVAAEGGTLQRALQRCPWPPRTQHHS